MCLSISICHKRWSTPPLVGHSASPPRLRRWPNRPSRGAPFGWCSPQLKNSIPEGREPTVHQLALTGLAGSVWSEAARDVYDLAARRNSGLCDTLFADGNLAPSLPSIASCRR